ncbi:TRZ/ATZ family hydrolase [Sedimenticola selenatireducens]|uniref:5-methylthioadenosine/S-adenosylhomocysteine deaminase n=2 Tax=Sedimenticola TaxID=349742 RepID=A0A2N6D099_9GAMM|nr:TRZ/ATZ family hydrolase [Sedimenticola selenatireducens]PLX63092.1 MAG: N-ethylammeline chlorohydrolase [Sedimenticola selenatireducens]
MNIDTLIFARWIIPVVPDQQVLEEHALAIHGGTILEILPAEQARTKYHPKSLHELPQHALIPGLINAHTHASMSLMRGLADDLPLMSWLNEHIWPAEGRWISEEFIADGTRLAVAEMLRGGTTCFNDMYFFPEVTGKVCAAAGMRAVVGLIIIDFPSAWASGPDEYIRRGLEVQDQFRNHGLISTAFAPHAPYTVSDQPFERIRVLADELEIPIHMHVHESRDEITQGISRYGNRPIERLQQLGLISPALTAVHMTQLEAEEIDLFAESGASVVHCPESNLKLASGFCPVAKLHRAGINIAIGTDGAASNNDLDMFSEMRSAALLAKGVADDASAIPAHTALRMATLNGAIALGMGERTGSLEPGKAADITAVDLGSLETQPLYHPISQLVYATGRDKVTDVWIAGKPVLHNGRLTTLDQREIISRAAEWQGRISEFE